VEAVDAGKVACRGGHIAESVFITHSVHETGLHVGGTAASNARKGEEERTFVHREVLFKGREGQVDRGRDRAERDLVRFADVCG
jgi:hypothetical protein